VAVDAIQWTGQNFAAVREFASGAVGIGTVMGDALPLWVVKSSATCHVELGDWIIREPDGSGFYPCAGDVFAATYEAPAAPDPETPLSDAQHRLGELRRMAESMVMSGDFMERQCGRRFLAALGSAGGGQERTEGDARHG
jgi:hypothetical protein